MNFQPFDGKYLRDTGDWKYVGKVEEHNHTFWRYEGRLVLVHCLGDYFLISGHRGRSLQQISDEFETWLGTKSLEQDKRFEEGKRVALKKTLGQNQACL